MKISKEKWAAMKARARGAGRRFAGGAKGSAVEGIVGVVGYFAHKTASEKIGFVGQNWYAGPAAMGVLGHVLKKKAKTASIGTALLGAAGYAGAFGYSLSKVAQKPDTKGLMSPGETGALQTVDPYYLPDSGDTDASPETSAYSDEDAAIASAMGL
jgi:hypothetical protein